MGITDELRHEVANYPFRDNRDFALFEDIADRIDAEYQKALDGFSRHHGSDTWERIIEDATALGAQMGRRTTQVDDLVARCKALAGDAE